MKKKMKKSLRIAPRPDTVAIGRLPQNKMGSIGEMKLIDLRDIEIAPYQKELSLERVEKIVKKFDINRMRPVDVSFRNGKYYLFDGQHRANAYYLMGYTEIPAIVHYGLTYEDEAYLFARQQEEVGAVNSNHKWNALREANDPETMEIIRLCKDWGFTVLEQNNKGNNIKCVKTLRDLYKEFGPQTLGSILRSLKESWNYMDHSTDVAIIGGISKLVRTYPQFNYTRLIRTLTNTTPKLILRDMEDKHHAVRGEANRAAYQIADIYNKGLVKAQRLDPQMLDKRNRTF